MTEGFQGVLGIVGPSFLLIALGYSYNLLAKADLNTLTGVSMRILTPAFVFSHISRISIDLGEIQTILISAWVIMFGSGIIAYFCLRHIPNLGRGIYLPIMFMNSVNLPIPIVLKAFGEEAVSYALMFYVASIVGIFSVGLLLVTGVQSMFRILREPVIFVLPFAFYVQHNNVEINETLMHAINSLASAMIPMVLMILGMQLSRVPLTEVKPALMATGLRFSCGFVMAWVCILIFGLEGLQKKVVLLEAMMPCAVITYVVAQKYDADAALVASSVFVSTVASLVIIPVTVWFLT